jgi:hypothetical protein
MQRRAGACPSPGRPRGAFIRSGTAARLEVYTPLSLYRRLLMKTLGENLILPHNPPALKSFLRKILPSVPEAEHEPEINNSLSHLEQTHPRNREAGNSDADSVFHGMRLTPYARSRRKSARDIEARIQDLGFSKSLP